MKLRNNSKEKALTPAYPPTNDSWKLLPFLRQAVEGNKENLAKNITKNIQENHNENS